MVKLRLVVVPRSKAASLELCVVESRNGYRDARLASRCIQAEGRVFATERDACPS